MGPALSTSLIRSNSLLPRICTGQRPCGSRCVTLAHDAELPLILSLMQSPSQLPGAVQCIVPRHRLTLDFCSSALVHDPYLHRKCTRNTGVTSAHDAKLPLKLPVLYIYPPLSRALHCTAHQYQPSRESCSPLLIVFPQFSPTATGGTHVSACHGCSASGFQ